MARGLRARLGIGLLSIAGMAAGHYLTYLVAAPHQHTRTELLQETGHAGESPFLILAISALLAACISVLAGHGARVRTRLWVTAVRLFVFQVGAFLALETGERIIAGADLGQAAIEPVLWLGILVQLLVAGAGAFILRALRSAAAVSTSRPPLPVSFELALCLGEGRTHPTNRTQAPWGARGPPHSS